MNYQMTIDNEKTAATNTGFTSLQKTNPQTAHLVLSTLKHNVEKLIELTLSLVTTRQ